jgi:hypothetical protein
MSLRRPREENGSIEAHQQAFGSFTSPSPFIYNRCWKNKPLRTEYATQSAWGFQFFDLARP